MKRAATVRLPLWVAGLALGPATVALVRARPSQAFADTPRLVGLELAVGWTLLTAGLVTWLRRPDNRSGVLLAAAGAGSFLTEWANPGIASTPTFTVGLVLYATGPPLVAHAVLAHPSGRTGSWAARALLALAYANSLLFLGLFQSLVYDPWGAGCTECPGNGLLIAAHPELLDALGRIGMTVGAVWPCVLIALLAGRAVGASPALRRVAAPMWAAGAVYAALVAADFVHGMPRHMLSNDPTDRRLWLAQEAALLLIATAAAWPWFHRRRVRGALADLVVELAAAPAPGGLRSALSRVLGDPSLTLAYPLADGRLVDAEGHPAEVGQGRGKAPAGTAPPTTPPAAADGENAPPGSPAPDSEGRTGGAGGNTMAEGEAEAVTAVVRGTRTLALLGHRPDTLTDSPEIARISRLALDNERLHAELAARMRDLRASQARIVAAGDTERRRLERDLHDGAQQRLLTLALTLRMARNGPAKTSPAAERAERELRAATEELRVLAHGLFPAVLAEEGLSAAVGALLEETQAPVEVTALPERRVGQAAEAAAYFTLAEAVAHHATTVGARLTGDHLLLTLTGTHGLDLVRIADRVGALDGTVTPGKPPHTEIRVEIPC
ncbi:sensor histidine kinase [Streptomyces sp. NPDC001663]|uniref:sensor histidine kinase n=1 Tax=Streptomyces sp. NPDC001663 TaxID=3364597 RepID=UPI003692CE1E